MVKYKIISEFKEWKKAPLYYVFHKKFLFWRQINIEGYHSLDEAEVLIKEHIEYIKNKKPIYIDGGGE